MKPAYEAAPAAEKNGKTLDRQREIQYINLKLAALGYPTFRNAADAEFLEITRPLFSDHQARQRMLGHHLSPADERIQAYLKAALGDCGRPVPAIPSNTFVLDRKGLARTMSLPPDQDSFSSDIINSYRVKQGVLHNPKSDRRTTQGVFHIAEGGLPIPEDKKAVPKLTYLLLLAQALRPPRELLRLPFTATQAQQAELFVSLLLRPVVCPEVPGLTPERSMEVRFFAPGNLVSNLDFVEAIFGNAGNPFLPENDAGLDIEHWTGHTGCVILAPHLVEARKKDLGLPHFDQATERQRRDGMCWKDPEERYNDGVPFKATCRDKRGVMVTLIADNYFGYCKKEVKTQISFSANLFGLCQEEHAGGAIAFPSYDLGESFSLDERLPQNGSTFQDIVRLFSDVMDVKPEGYGVDRRYPNILYLPEDARFDVNSQRISWCVGDKPSGIKLHPGHYYLLPSGYKITMEKQMGGTNWRLFGTTSEGTLCHKPSTVSGGGKSEISKSIRDFMVQGPVYIGEYYQDIEVVEAILRRDFGDRFRNPHPNPRPSRPILSPQRSLGSVIKLLTPLEDFSDEYNAWLQSLPQHIKDLIFVIKRYYRPEWEDNWHEHFHVDRINGTLGHELKFGNKKLIAHYLRIGMEQDGSWRLYKVRSDYNAAEKLQVEDDITSSIVVPAGLLEGLSRDYANPSVKLVRNCESRLFQRPDDAVHPGFDSQAEKDISADGVFLSNFEPLTREEARRIVEDVIRFDQYTAPVKRLLASFLESDAPEYVVCSSEPRRIDGKPSKNPRYLQERPDLADPQKRYLAEMGVRLFRLIPPDKPAHMPVSAVLPGRRNNPADREQGVPPLAVYNPIHYQELPELFMDFITSVTGKSPSTTGFGSEGALTKGPFNALVPTADLNNALLDFILTGYSGFTTAAGYVGPRYQVDHDISLLIPEIWCRMQVRERDPGYLIKNGYLEPLKDFKHNGRVIPASRLGYRITLKFVQAFGGRIFNNPNAVFTEDMLKPELQDKEVFVEGVESIVLTQQRVAKQYFSDGSIASACPPLKALLHVMAEGHYEGKTVQDAAIRDLFKRDVVLGSAWYAERLRCKQERDRALWQRHIAYLERAIEAPTHVETVERMDLRGRLDAARRNLERVSAPEYLDRLQGTIGADPLA